MRVVLDTNCVVSALLFDGRLAWMRATWQRGSIVPLVSQATVRELLRVLQYPKFRLAPAEREEVLAEFLPYTLSVQVSEKEHRLPPVRDPYDRPFLALALSGRAEAIATGDDDLRSLGHSFAVPILSPGALRDRLTKPGSKP